MNESNNDAILTQTQNLIDEQVICPHCRGQYRRRGLARHIHCAHGNVQVPATPDDNNQDEPARDNFTNHLFIRGFDAPLLNSAGPESITNGMHDGFVQ